MPDPNGLYTDEEAEGLVRLAATNAEARRMIVRDNDRRTAMGLNRRRMPAFAPLGLDPNPQPVPQPQEVGLGWRELRPLDGRVFLDPVNAIEDDTDAPREDGVKDLNLDDIPPSNRKVLQPFYLEYETLEEARMRFQGTVIMIKSLPFYVRDVRSTRKQRVYQFYVQDEFANQFKVKSSDIQDFRSPPPGYVNYQGSVAWLKRLPSRANQLGLHRNNAQLIAIEGENRIGFAETAVVPALKPKPILSFSENIRTLLTEGHAQQFRLSSEIAVYAKNTKTRNIICDFKGRKLGKVEENTVILDDEDDLLQPHLTQAAQEVNFNLKAT